MAPLTKDIVIEINIYYSLSEIISIEVAVEIVSLFSYEIITIKRRIVGYELKLFAKILKYIEKLDITGH